MIYRTFKDKELSLLGFGAMRFPLLEDGSINEEEAARMIDYALKNGVNYIDTAWPYHNETSEIVTGKILSKYDRNSFYLATKFPGNIPREVYNAKEIFEAQLAKCQVEYFDFYLLHNVNERTIGTYLDPRWGIIDYLKEEKRNGRIKHLGFSCHGQMDLLEDFLDKYGDVMEFCQLQVNYLDWTLQNAKGKYELLEKHNIPMWVMEPVRGGKLAVLRESEEAKLKAVRPDESIASWGFRFLQDLPNVGMILSGMSTMEQVEDNIKTFSEYKPLSEEERNLLLDLAEEMKKSIPCTACRYCTKGCPMQLDIPMLLALSNEYRFSPNPVKEKINALPEDKRPDKCIACGACMHVCPQNINIPEELRKLAEAVA
ncbi:MAG: aldo/keto reductase [Erysipelotrichales bacterium]|nr:aldo/keto reductase [Erysipelotrichales bacterium]